MPDYGCWPLWEASPEVVGNIDPASLPISNSLREDLENWARIYDATLKRANPAASGFSDKTAEKSFKSNGVALAIRLQEELGKDFEINLRG
jgi:hypothetical protein